MSVCQIFKSHIDVKLRKTTTVVLSDLFHCSPCYSTEGVYQHVTGEMVARHAIKILGWGKENGTPYWLAANSWNSDWGDKGATKPNFGTSCFLVTYSSGHMILCLFISGFFKIQRGNDECGIEADVVTGMPFN